jgi:hypothetical protein
MKKSFERKQCLINHNRSDWEFDQIVFGHSQFPSEMYLENLGANRKRWTYKRMNGDGRWRADGVFWLRIRVRGWGREGKKKGRGKNLKVPVPEKIPNHQI